MTIKVIRIVQYEGTEEAVRSAIQKSMPLGIKECTGYTMTIAEHFNNLPPLAQISDEDVQTALLADAVEARAKEIYATWSEHDDYRPWVDGGNSIMQDQARSLAYTELAKQ